MTKVISSLNEKLGRCIKKIIVSFKLLISENQEVL